MKIIGMFLASLVTLGASALAMPPPSQSQNISTDQTTQQTQTTMAVEPLAQTPTFRVNVISRTVQAVNYRYRGGATTLGFGIEGNTDSVGGDEYNQGLSERRAEAVRSYLAQQGVPESSMTAKGLGKTQPVASNSTAEGRQQNRRVELIVSGEVIGTKIGTITPPQAR